MIREDNKLLMAEHEKYGIWYFTTVYIAAKELGYVYNTLRQKFNVGNFKHDGWTFEWIDGDDVIYRYINPTQNKIYD